MRLHFLGLREALLGLTKTLPYLVLGDSKSPGQLTLADAFPVQPFHNDPKICWQLVNSSANVVQAWLVFSIFIPEIGIEVARIHGSKLEDFVEVTLDVEQQGAQRFLGLHLVAVHVLDNMATMG